MRELDPSIKKDRKYFINNKHHEKIYFLSLDLNGQRDGVVSC